MSWPNTRWTTRLIALNAELFLAAVAWGEASVRPIGSEYVLKQWESDNRDVPYHSIPSIRQTSDGYLWLATFKGVARFDGLRFVVFDHRNASAIEGELVTRVHVDKHGTLWAGSERGVARYAGGQWTRPSWPSDQSPDIVWSFAEDQQSTLWVGTEHRVLRWNGGAFEAVAPPLAPPLIEPIPSPDYTVLSDTSGQLWLKTPFYIGRRQSDQWITIYQTNRSAFRGIGPGRTDGVWVADLTDVFKLEGDRRVRTIPRPAEALGDPVQLLEDSQGQVWMGCYAKGLFVLKPDGSVLRGTTAEGLANNSVLSLFEDDEQNVWAGLNGGGLARFRLRSFQSHGDADAAVQNVMNSMVETTPGQLLVATHGSGLLRFEGRRFQGPILSDTNTPFQANSLRPDSWVLSVVKDRQGVLWAGAFGEGLFRIGSNSVEQIPRSQIGGRDVHALFLDSKDRLWIGTESNVTCRVQGGFTGYDKSRGVPASTVTAFSEDDTGAIWMCTLQDQLLRLDGDRFTEFRSPELAGIVSPCLYRDGRGSLWIGTGSQILARYRGQELQVYSARQGLPQISITTIIEDEAGDLWLGSRQGAARVRRSSLDAVAEGRQTRLDCQLFDKNDGLRTTLFRSGGLFPASFRASDGVLWFATVKGLAEVDPKMVRTVGHPPAVWIEELTVDGHAQLVDPVSPSRVRLPAGARRLDIRYTAPKPGLPDGIRFERRIDGLDEDWVDTGEERHTELLDLRPGSYRLEVRAFTKDGIPSRNTAQLGFLVAPFFWQTLWFKLALGCGSFAAIIWVVRVVMMRRLRLELERAEKRRIERHAAELDAANQVLESRKRELEEALSKVKTLSGLIPICSFCKKIRNDQGFWDRVESYLQKHSDAMFTHGLCPDCAHEHFGTILPEKRPPTAPPR